MYARMFIALAFFSLCFFGATAQERSETWKSVTVDSPFEIALVTNPSTGYEWLIDKKASADLRRLAIDDLGNSPPPQQRGKRLIGAWVIHTWLVTPREPGTARLVLIYHRGFDEEREPPIKTHVFHIEIAK